MKMQKISNCLWFDSEALEAAKYYTSIFPNSKINTVTKYPKASEKVSGKKAGTILTVAFTLDGQEFMALNGGPIFKFTEANSLVVHCKNQKEIDHYWEKLSYGGDKKAQACGWLKDKYGLSWQIVPMALEKIMGKNHEKAMAELLKMKKIDINKLKNA